MNNSNRGPVGTYHLRYAPNKYLGYSYVQIISFFPGIQFIGPIKKRTRRGRDTKGGFFKYLAQSIMAWWGFYFIHKVQRLHGNILYLRLGLGLDKLNVSMQVRYKETT